MATFPFELQIDCIPSGKGAKSVLCNAHLREIPGRREVYDAVWNDRAVVAKVFSRRIGASRRLRKERAGLNRLKSCGVNTPELLFCGKTPDGRLAIVTEKIADSSTVLEALQNTGSVAERADLLVQVCRELARQHVNGVLQKDLHLGNFLLDGERIFTLDPGQMQFFGQAVTRSKSISQLALLARNLPADEAESISRLYREYFAARHWNLEKADETRLREQIKSHARRTMKRQLRKCVRTSKRTLRIKTSRHLAVFDRTFCRGARPEDFIGQIDDLMDKGRILKVGNTSHVSRLNWNGRDIVVKRYNHKGFVHSLRHTIKRSRARHSWLHAHRLGVLRIATAKPVAYIEQLKGLLVWNSYLVTEYIEGQQLDCFLQDCNVSREQRAATTRRTLDLLGKLQDNRITHSDLKHSNILITDSGPVLIDLDAMAVHRLRWVAAWKGRKYINRFAKGGLQEYGRI
jgi:tRNA A-37 threonylcarbamoyl transferase component Bud32